jgi:hypothetical protein
MLRLGLTGGIASGKTAVAAMFREMGFDVLDADSSRTNSSSLANPPTTKSSMTSAPPSSIQTSASTAPS